MDPTAWEAIDIFSTLSRWKVLVCHVLLSKLCLGNSLDPEGKEERRAHRLRRRTYRNTGPNDAWHCDGYDKLKPSSSLAGLNVPWRSKSLKKLSTSLFYFL